MAHEEKGNKNAKKPATKAPKVHGAPRVPKYEQTESGINPPEPARKGKK